MTPMFVASGHADRAHAVRKDHRFADEQRHIRPGGVAQDLPPNAATEIAEALQAVAPTTARNGRAAHENAIWKARTQGVGYLDPDRMHGTGHHRPDFRQVAHDLRKSEPYCGYQHYEFDVITDDSCDAYGRYMIRVKEMWGVDEDRGAVSGQVTTRPDHDLRSQARWRRTVEGLRAVRLTWRFLRRIAQNRPGRRFFQKKTGHRGHPGAGGPGLRRGGVPW
ncbi:hypothetical protein ABLN97_11740 [Mycobacterium tuberculosis]